MQAYEKLGVFYLGRYHDPAASRTLPDLVLYDSADLLTHGLCVGMTGSGKTGLCVALIEEAALDGIPAILIDPKGDLANLLLNFPALRPEDFAPWVNEDDARKKGLTVAGYAAEQAERWRAGLAAWDQDSARLERLRAAADFAIYTPGSNAGLPVSVLGSFAAPPPDLREDPDQLRDRVNTTVSGLLGLVGIEADPVRGRETILLANLLHHAWQNGRDLDLATLIQEIQTPPFNRVGVMEIESFFPAKDRFGLATALNGLLASPGFQAWLEGEPLDIQRFLYTPEGKPRVAIFSIAHLADAERMFFVTLLLNEVLGWMRRQSGTTSLRALLYMDEIFGYFPPVANPPSKAPLLTLLKQARAYGLGLVLATQNPVDLDYKGLANIGTWFIGRLQTERDQRRVLDGLEGAAAAQSSAFDRSALEQVLAGLGNRVFLLHNVHEDSDALFESRWALSYLRGPLARNQIKVLMDARRARPAAARPTASPPAARVSSAPSAARLSPGLATRVPPELGVPEVSAPPAEPPPAPEPAATSAPATGESPRPTLPPTIPQFFLPTPEAAGPTSHEPRLGARVGDPQGRGGEARFMCAEQSKEQPANALVYEPRLLGAAQVRFTDTKLGIDVTQPAILLTAIHDSAVPVDWAEAEDADLDLRRLDRNPAAAARFRPLPASASQPKNYERWTKDLVAALQGRCRLALRRSPRLDQVSRPDETEAAFRTRLQLAAREQRDEAAARLRAKYAPRLATLQERLRRAEQAVEREQAQARTAKLSTALSFGATLLGAFMGRKVLSATNVSRAGTAFKGVGRSVEQSQDVARAEQTVEAVRQQLAELDAQFEAELAVAATVDPLAEELDTLELRPSKTNIAVQLVALVWVPVA